MSFIGGKSESRSDYTSRVSWAGRRLGAGLLIFSPLLACAADPAQLAGGWKMRVSPIDWGITAAYAVAMLSIGWYYSRQVASADDYFLGGRRMKSSATGLSLFSTLVSTISYLSLPGEMIRHGPMMLAQIAAYPLIAFIVGRFLISYFMRLQVTSAYELLELRFGLFARLLGASLFLAIRLMWMGMIIHATTAEVLVPLLRLPAEAGPWLSCLLVGVTMAYSTMGGLRAVVVTDVVQTFLMLAGAVFTLGLITYSLGGVDGWWPNEWNAVWDEPIVWFEAEKRTFAGAFLTALLWWTCTASSDQLAIQRYLSTPDVKTARRAFNIALVADGFSTTLMFLVGMALLAYFHANPGIMPEGFSLRTHADQLFPLYIGHGLPLGVGGLVIAALLAAAMSSLSSGVNSTTSVIVTDFIQRFRKAERGEPEQILHMRVISVLIGVLVIAISLGVNHVEGNLLEVGFKISNLLVGPLAVLYLLAIFVPWANSIGVICAVIASVATAIGIAYFGLFSIGFLWIMPAALVMGIVVGMLFSLARLQRRRQSDPVRQLSDDS